MSRIARLLAWPPGAALFVLLACGSDGGGGSSESGETGEGSTSTGVASPTSSSSTTTSGDASSGTTHSGATSEGSASGDSSSEGSSSEESSSGEPAGAAWLRSFGAPEAQRAGGLGFTAGGELWVAGDVYGGIDLGTGALTGEGSGIYLARYGVDGDTLHAQAIYAADGQPTLTTVTGLAVDGAGAVVLTGWLEGSHEIGGALLAADELDVFVGKWDADGAPAWGRKFGEADWQVGYALAVGPDDEIWVAGAALAPFTAGEFELTGAASTGMFVVRLAADGTPTYGRWWGEMGDQEARAVAVCADGSIALAGFVTAPLGFGAEEVVAVGDKDMFVAQLDADGEPQWIRGLGGASADLATHVRCDDGPLFAGTVSGAANIGPIALTPSGDADAVLGRFAADGALTWAAGVTGPEDQVPGGLGVSADGEVFVAVTSAGTTTLGEQTLDGAGERDVVLARYVVPATSPTEVTRLGDAGREVVGALAVRGAVAALAASHAGTLAWPGLAPVGATGVEDLAVLRWPP